MLTLLLLRIVISVYGKECYWNTQCPYPYYGSKTPYETVRGDIREYRTLDNCESVSIWALHRHGNRNPSASAIHRMKEVVNLKEEIITSHEKGRSQLCDQDIENLKKWDWDSTIDDSESHLTDTGYEEMYNMGKRIRHKYSHLLQGSAKQFYFRPTRMQRTIASCKAFIRGLTDGVDIHVTVDRPWKKDDIISPYEGCARYHRNVLEGQLLAQQLQLYFVSPEFKGVYERVQKRLGIKTLLNEKNVFSMYDLCRFYRSWSVNLQSPWCAVFTNEDLLVLEYFDDVRHYYRNGYGYKINEHLGEPPLKDLYKQFDEVVKGRRGRKIIAYFTHDVILEMAWCALGLYSDEYRIVSVIINPDRQWRTSYFSAFASNMMAVLNRCHEGDNTTYRVQVFINELVAPICPIEGCTWKRFQDIFQGFSNSDLDFCDLDYVYRDKHYSS